MFGSLRKNSLVLELSQEKLSRVYSVFFQSESLALLRRLRYWGNNVPQPSANGFLVGHLSGGVSHVDTPVSWSRLDPKIVYSKSVELPSVCLN
ncbi:unnamed protein product [Stenotrophomonas maltophilia]|nr:unnamed protein product [Stenotrophomonas maltophilia]